MYVGMLKVQVTYSLLCMREITTVSSDIIHAKKGIVCIYASRVVVILTMDDLFKRCGTPRKDDISCAEVSQKTNGQQIHKLIYHQLLIMRNMAY